MQAKQFLALLFAPLLAFQLAGCGKVGGAAADPAKNEEKLQIVFEYQDGRVNADFEPILEALFDVDIVMEMNKSANPYLRLEEELTHGMAPDLVLCEFIKRIEDDILEQYFYDLGSEGFVKNYYLSAIEACTASDGGLYYLPGPSYVYGIVYDKTAFAALNLTVPTNYSEFV